MHRPNAKMKLYVVIAVVLTLVLTILYLHLNVPTAGGAPALSGVIE